MKKVLWVYRIVFLKLKNTICQALKSSDINGMCVEINIPGLNLACTMCAHDSSVARKGNNKKVKSNTKFKSIKKY